MLFLKLQSWLYVLCKLESPDAPEESSLFSASYLNIRENIRIIKSQFDSTRFHALFIWHILSAFPMEG